MKRRTDLLGQEHWTEQPDNPVTYMEKATIIKALPTPTHEVDAYHLLNRAEQAVMVRLCLGHNRLNAHMHIKLKLVQSLICAFGEEEQTTEYVLQQCRRHDQEWNAKWPQGVSLHQKPGYLDDLRQTTSFIADTGLVI